MSKRRRSQSPLQKSINTSVKLPRLGVKNIPKSDVILFSQLGESSITFTNDLYNNSVAFVLSRRDPSDASDEVDYSVLFDHKIRRKYSTQDVEAIKKYIDNGHAYLAMIKVLSEKLNISQDSLTRDIHDIHAFIDLYAEFLETPGEAMEDLCDKLQNLSW